MKRIIGFVFLFAIGVGTFFAWRVYTAWFAPVVEAPNAPILLYVPTGSTAHDVQELLQQMQIALHPTWTEKLMQRKQYTGKNVEPGRYELSDGMSLNDIVNHLRGGKGETQVRITFHTARTMQELAGKVATHIEADSASVAQLLLDPKVAGKYGFNSHTFKSMFLPDTYFAEWDTDAAAFVQRMAGEYKRFWTEERMAKAGKLGLSQSEVATLASIVQAEQQNHADELPVIAGLYLNRLRMGMRLQSDPTVVYAVGDFNINRVLNVHLAVNSPYNTYQRAGLPPGPINVPQKKSIDAVLNPTESRYVYMCAKADFSGRHAFASTLSEHNRNAAAYRKALNERKIYK